MCVCDLHFKTIPFTSKVTENYVQYRSNVVIRNLLGEIRLELDLECLDLI